MPMTPRLRKFALTAHVTSAVGWLGAVVAYLVLAVSGLTSPDAQTVRAAYLSLELVGWYVVVPLALAALVTGLVQSLGTEWGLFRHYWVLAKFVLTVGAVTVLLMHIPSVSRMSGVAAETTLSGSDHRAERVQLVVHAGGGLLVLLAATVLSVFKPWGKTRCGRRKQAERHNGAPTGPTATPAAQGGTHTAEPPSRPDGRAMTRTPWALYLLLGVICLVVLFAVLHLASGGRGNH